MVLKICLFLRGRWQANAWRKESAELLFGCCVWFAPPSVVLLFLLYGGELVALERIFLEPCETGVFCFFLFYTLLFSLCFSLLLSFVVCFCFALSFAFAELCCLFLFCFFTFFLEFCLWPLLFRFCRARLYKPYLRLFCLARRFFSPRLVRSWKWISRLRAFEYFSNLSSFDIGQIPFFDAYFSSFE